MNSKPSSKIAIKNIEEPLSYAAQCPSILEALEKANIEVTYQCREGFCGACRAQLNSGEVIYNQEPLAFVRDGEILMCCSKPVTDISITLI